MKLFPLYYYTILILCISSVCTVNVGFIQRRLLTKTRRFFASLMPNTCAQVILNEEVRNQYISQSLTGRVSPIGTFTKTESALEYVYGLLCSIPNLPAQTDLIKKVTVLRVDYSKDKYKVSVKVKFELTTPKTFIVFGALAFDRQMKLCGYEGVIQNPGLTVDIPDFQQPLFIENLCQGIQQICRPNTPDEQYTNITDCINFLSTNVPFGTPDRADQGNVICRAIHLRLTPLLPNIHCPNLGKTGGEFCIDKSAQSYFETPNDFTLCAYKYR